MTMVKISDCFHYIITLLCYVLKMAGMICKLDRFLEICRLRSAICKLAGQSINWQIGRNIFTPNWEGGGGGVQRLSKHPVLVIYC